ncbi:MAG: hypothetical protein OZ919_06725 [Xanthomonadaceae bacterium]|nr:hypothetical protein [Xanthomonadaceae bacterium]
MLDFIMIFAASTDDRSLIVFPSDAEAISRCEGLDVEAGNWLFWDRAGNPLEPVFTTPNKRGLFSVQSGVYHLVPSDGRHHAHLSEAVFEILHFEGSESLTSAQAVVAFLAEQLQTPKHKPGSAHANEI